MGTVRDDMKVLDFGVAAVSDDMASDQGMNVQGMRAMARLKSDRKALEQVARVALAILI